jgi:hypothetical protein
MPKTHYLTRAWEASRDDGMRTITMARPHYGNVKSMEFTGPAVVVMLPGPISKEDYTIWLQRLNVSGFTVRWAREPTGFLPVEAIQVLDDEPTQD